MLQKELSKRLRDRYDTKMDGNEWLEVSSDGIPLCRIKYNGQFLSNADQNLSDEYRSKIADIQDEISTVREYVGLYEHAPQMKAADVSDYRQLAAFGDTVLAATYSEKNGFMFCTWKQNADGDSVFWGDYSPNYEYVKETFAVRSGLVNKHRLFSEKESADLGMTEAGLADINESESVYTDSVKRGYSDCTMRITYAATLTADAKLGDTDNPNEVVLTWKRTNTSYYDTLQDCCHLYTYGVDVLKQFSDGKGDLTNVSFLLRNDTDGVYVIAEQRDGMYYVKGFTDKKIDATTFVPNGSGHIIVNGLEDDTYTLTETATDKGYVLLKDGIEIIITAAEGESACETCGAKLLTASGTVNGDAVDMEDGNAIVPLTVINNPGFDLPKTGGYGTWMFTVGGCMLLGVAAFIVARGRKHNRNDQ